MTEILCQCIVSVPRPTPRKNQGGSLALGWGGSVSVRRTCLWRKRVLRVKTAAWATEAKVSHAIEGREDTTLSCGLAEPHLLNPRYRNARGIRPGACLQATCSPLQEFLHSQSDCRILARDVFPPTLLSAASFSTWFGLTFWLPTAQSKKLGISKY